MTIKYCCLARNIAELSPAVPAFLHYNPRLATLPQWVRNAQILLQDEPEAVVTRLLGAGAKKVFLGEAALFDSSMISRLVKTFGSARIGLQVAVQRQPVSWTFETQSNEDFNVVTPSLCEPVWEVLKADGKSSGVRAHSWIQTMVGHGVSTVLIRSDICDDTDLNLCAGMVESLGDKLWVAPLSDGAPPLADWIEFGQVRQLALPLSLYHRRHALTSATADKTAVLAAA